ncbi:MAG TPA: PAS domain-containing sensor histidine kinase, partial [Rhizobiaceae bacterium]|nr:PAS domain-containing sensor histidine kinase [Rhizobiaceae bacterium]
MALQSEVIPLDPVEDAPVRRWRSVRLPVQGVIAVIGALVTAAISFVILTGLTTIEPDGEVIAVAMVANGVFVAWLVFLIGKEIFRIAAARRRGKAASRLHVRIVTLFSLVAAIPAIAIALVASVTLDLGLDRWFEIRTKTIVSSSLHVARSYLNENATNLRDTSVNLAFLLDSQRSLYSLDRTGFRQLLTQQALARGLLGASVLRNDGTPIISADITTDRPLPAVPGDALDALKDGRPVIIPPGVTNLVGSVVQLRDIPEAILYTVRAVDPEVIASMRLMEQNTD